jgi:hypothetical protein
MTRSHTRALVIFGLALLSAAAADGVHAQPPSDLPDVDSAQSATPGTDRHEAVLRSWQDRVKLDGREEPRRFEIIFDYRFGTTWSRIYDMEGRLISEEELAAQPRATAAEIEKAINAVRRDPELSQLASSTNAVLDGGFLLHERAGKPCGPHTRCVQIFMLTDPVRERPHIAVVDVRARGRIAHRNYNPDATD